MNILKPRNLRGFFITQGKGLGWGEKDVKLYTHICVSEI